MIYRLSVTIAPPDCEHEEAETVCEPVFYLFRVYVINKCNAAILMDGKPVIAQDEREAEYEAGVPALLTEKRLSIQDVDVICEEVSEVEVE